MAAKSVANSNFKDDKDGTHATARRSEERRERERRNEPKCSQVFNSSPSNFCAGTGSGVRRKFPVRRFFFCIEKLLCFADDDIVYVILDEGICVRRR